MHDCPVLRNLAIKVPSMASLKSASSNTSTGACPPNSSESGLTCFAAPSINFFPTSVEPVKEIFRQSGLSRNSCPISAAEPAMSWNTAVGKPAVSTHSAKTDAHNGVRLAGFKITVHPAASAGATFLTASTSGKFQGLIAPTTPMGVLMIKWRFSSTW